MRPNQFPGSGPTPAALLNFSFKGIGMKVYIGNRLHQRMQFMTRSPGDIASGNCYITRLGKFSLLTVPKNWKQTRNPPVISFSKTIPTMAKQLLNNNYNGTPMWSYINNTTLVPAIKWSENVSLIVLLTSLFYKRRRLYLLEREGMSLDVNLSPKIPDVANGNKTAPSISNVTVKKNRQMESNPFVKLFVSLKFFISLLFVLYAVNSLQNFLGGKWGSTADTSPFVTEKK